MSLRGQAALIMWMGFEPDARALFTMAHTHEHLQERLSLPGFLGARRYRSKARPDRFFVLYEGERLDAFTSEQYRLSQDSPTVLTRLVSRMMLAMERGICRVISSESVGASSHLATLQLRPGPGSGLSTVVEQLIALVAQSHLTGFHLLDCLREESAAVSIESRERAVSTSAPGTVLLLESLESMSGDVERVADALVSCGWSIDSEPEEFVLQLVVERGTAATVLNEAKIDAFEVEGMRHA